MRGCDFLEEAPIQLRQAFRSQALQFTPDGIRIPPQLGDVYALAGIGQQVEPLNATLQHLERAAIIAALDLIVSDADLQYGAIEIAHWSGGRHPLFFKEIVLPIVFAAIEKLETLRRQRWKSLVALASESRHGSVVRHTRQLGDESAQLSVKLGPSQSQVGAHEYGIGPGCRVVVHEANRDAAGGGVCL